ncbi:MAG TPA: aromatic ring-hydroxylating dioxygenase subunit alpha [Caulobacteraceae bacterium]|nr:aromatic ring-hydroxylating dioxygenase subunit alpha [Caulobacteraceae bacterium]
MADDVSGQAGLAPADFFTASAFAAEQALFTGGWVAVCRAEELEGPGAQKAVTVAGQPVLVTRDEAGALHALSNVCRHRGFVLVDEDATAPVVRCPYHLWTYRLDGALAAAPFMDGVDVSRCDLPRYAIETWAGFVFVNLDGRAAPLAATLEPLAARVDPERLAGWRIGLRIPFEHDWNWKVMVENFSESYHHIGAHAATLQPLWPGGESCSSKSTDVWVELTHSTHPEAGTFTVYTVFPSFMLAIAEPGEWAYWYRMVPEGPERFSLEILGLFPPEAIGDVGAIEAATAQLTAIHLEDIEMCQRTQAGLRAPDAALGPLSPLEAGIARFRAWVARGRA